MKRLIKSGAMTPVFWGLLFLLTIYSAANASHAVQQRQAGAPQSVQYERTH